MPRPRSLGPDKCDWRTTSGQAAARAVGASASTSSTQRRRILKGGAASGTIAGELRSGRKWGWGTTAGTTRPDGRCRRAEALDKRRRWELMNEVTRRGISSTGRCSKRVWSRNTRMPKQLWNCGVNLFCFFIGMKHFVERAIVPDERLQWTAVQVPELYLSAAWSPSAGAPYCINTVKFVSAMQIFCF